MVSLCCRTTLFPWTIIALCLGHPRTDCCFEFCLLLMFCRWWGSTLLSSCTLALPPNSVAMGFDDCRHQRSFSPVMVKLFYGFGCLRSEQRLRRVKHSKGWFSSAIFLFREQYSHRIQSEAFKRNKFFPRDVHHPRNFHMTPPGDMILFCHVILSRREGFVCLL